MDSTTGKSEIVEEQCDMLVACDTPDISPNLHSCISESSLVYEGRLIVDKNFQTNDPRIYGAGTMAKFSRSVKNPIRHEYCNSRQVGQEAGKSIAKILKNTGNNDQDSDSPRLSWGSKAIGCSLPGGTFFAFAGSWEYMETPSILPPQVWIV